MKRSRVLFFVIFIFSMSCARTSFKPVDPRPENKQTATPETPAPAPTPPAAVAPPVPVVAGPPLTSPTTTPVPLPPTTPPVVTVPPPKPPPPVCEPVAAITRLTKILFLVDMSGSNRYSAVVGEHEERTVPATDPEKKFRIGSIRRFVEKFQNKKNFQWGFVTFGGPSAKDFILR